MPRSGQDASSEANSQGDSIDRMSAELAAAFPDLDLSGFSITGRLLVLAAHVNSAREAVLHQCGLTLADYDVLATLRRQDVPGGVNPRTLQQSITVTSGGLTKRLDRLEQRGLLARRPDPDDRRGVRIVLTAEGRRLFARALPAVLAAEGDIVHRGVGSEEAEAHLAHLLRCLLGAWERSDGR